MEEYLRATGREKIADIANSRMDLLMADPDVEQQPENI